MSSNHDGLGIPDPWEVRLLDKVVIDNNGCWIFQGAITKGGYGLFHGPERQEPAHRLSYKAIVGDIPEGLELDHLCRNPPCINPDHLEPVTKAENLRRAAAAQTHCKYGHPFSPENTRITSVGTRQCITCKRAYEKAAYQRRKRSAA